MNELTTLLATAEINRTAVQNDAIRAHQRVIMDRQMVVCGLSNLCRDLKEIRDMRHYATLGYSDFGRYTEEQHGIGERQAYKYIRIFERLGAEFLNLNSKIGVTKLLELAVLDRDERDKLLSEHNTDELADMSVSEVKQLVDGAQELHGQMDMFDAIIEADKPETPSETDIEARLREKIEAEYAEQIAELESKVMTDAELADFRREAEKEAAAKTSDAVKQLKADLKAAKDGKTAAEKARVAAETAKAEADKKLKEFADSEKQLKELKERIDAAEAEKAATEKQIRLSADPEYARFKYMFERWQADTHALVEQLFKCDESKHSKLIEAIKKVMEGQGL